MTKILVIYTGGTIGMEYGPQGLMPMPGLFQDQIDSLNLFKGNQVKLIEYSPLIDSSDIGLNHWQQIIADISANYAEFDGFIIVHGTDTMAYTASVLAFALRGLAKPVVLTGSQLPLVHQRSDGWHNLIDAVVAASHPQLHEVAIAFNNKLLRGCRAQKISTYRFLGFDSVDAEPLAEFGINIDWFTQRWLPVPQQQFAPIMPKPARILDLSLRPGFTTEFIAETLSTTPLDALVLQTYGSGNIPRHNQQLVAALEDAVARGVIIVNITQVIEGGVSNDYANSCLHELGVISGCDLTIEAAYAKLLMLLSSDLTAEQIKAMISQNLVGELSE